MVCTFWPEAASTPRGVLRPDVTTSPAAFLSCQSSAAVASVTRVAFFGPAGRYPTWLTRTRGPVSGTYGGFSSPPISETLSRHSRYSAAAPPTWKATWPAVVSSEAVNVYSRCCRVGVKATSRLRYDVYGSAPSWTAARTVAPGVAVASND